MRRLRILVCVLLLAASAAYAVTTFTGGSVLIQGETLTGRSRVNAIFIVETAGGAGGYVRVRTEGASGPVFLAGNVSSNDTVQFMLPSNQVLKDIYVDVCPTGVAVVVLTP